MHLEYDKEMKNGDWKFIKRKNRRWRGVKKNLKEVY